MKSKTGAIIIGKEEILSRWDGYIGDLFEDDRRERPEVYKEMGGNSFLKDEIESFLRMQYGKPTGPDSIPVEMLEALECIGINKMESMLNKMHDKGTIPKSLSRSILVTLPKKPGTTECERHRTISLMSHITTLILKILMKRTKRAIREETANVLCGFTEGKGTTNAIFIMHNIIDRSIEVKEDLYLCFIDYSKAFYKVRHHKLFDTLNSLNSEGKTLRWIKNYTRNRLLSLEWKIN